MNTDVRECGMCARPIADDEPAYRCRVYRKQGRRYESSNTSVCRACADRARVDGVWRSEDGRRDLYDVPDHDRSEACAACGRPTVVRADKRRKVVSCSDRCRLSYYASRRPVSVNVTVCQVCDNDIVGGRAGRRFCSDACRQKAYRRREQFAAGVEKLSTEYGMNVNL